MRQTLLTYESVSKKRKTARVHDLVSDYMKKLFG